nr:MAG TPA: hypothetical protein [Caudoviricetes sp.]
MAKVEIKGINEYTAALSKLSKLVQDNICGKAIYEGAAIVMDSVQSGISSIPTTNQWGTPSNPVSGINAKQKAALHNSVGIAKMRNDDGYFNVKIGFDGYNDIKTKRWPNGQPNQMIARSVERGTSFLKSTPFMKKAVSASKKRAISIMGFTIDKEIDELMKG